MRALNYYLNCMCKRNPDGSRSSQANRRYILQLIANELFTLGFNLTKPENIKPKHVNALLKLWNDKNLSAGTIKNRMAVLRWWCQKINKPDLIKPNNDAYNIKRRQYVTNINKALEINEEVLSAILNPYIKTSLELQRAFGLRREESIKFIPAYADKGNRLQLKGSWCKGGRERTIPIRNDYQREVLKRAYSIARNGSLIPPDLNYREQLKRYENICAQAGLTKLHGLRHRYAQQRYEELTGWKSPVAGGPTRKELTEQQKIKDRQARLLISGEMGHHREAITAVYLGR